MAWEAAHTGYASSVGIDLPVGSFCPGRDTLKCGACRATALSEHLYPTVRFSLQSLYLQPHGAR